MRRSKNTSFNHLVGEREQGSQYGQPECVGGLELGNQLELRRELNWRLARFFALQYSIHVVSGVPKVVNDIVPVSHKSADLGKGTIKGDRRKVMADGDLGNLSLHTGSCRSLAPG
jgi:hypothetical protein